MGYIDEESIARSHSKRMSRYNAQQAGESGRKGSMADAEPWVVFYTKGEGYEKESCDRDCCYFGYFIGFDC